MLNHKSKISRVVFAPFLLLILGFGQLNSSTASCNLDQSQENSSFGFWFEDDVIRWQEFVPTFSVLCKLELYIRKVGKAGDVIVQVRNQHDGVVWQGAIREVDLVNGWNSLIPSPIVGLTPAAKHRIYVYTNADSPNPSNRYFWQGNKAATYSGGVTDVETGWPGFDYAFKTCADSSVTLPKVDLVTDATAYIIGDTMKLTNWKLTNGPESKHFDWRMWIQLPGGTTISIIRMDQISLSPNEIIDITGGTPMSFITFSTGMPIGRWQIGNRLIDNLTSSVLSLDTDQFTLSTSADIQKFAGRLSSDVYGVTDKGLVADQAIRLLFGVHKDGGLPMRNMSSLKENK